MPDEKTDKVLTVFKLTPQLRNKAQEDAKIKKLSVSELLTDKLDDLLKMKSTPDISKLKKGKSNLISTSVLLPEGVLKASRHKAIECGVSLADIFRFCLYQ
jgi:hypothetical protein